MFELSTKYLEGLSPLLLGRNTAQVHSGAILIAIKVCRGSIPQPFFELHPAAAWNRSLKGAKLASTLYNRLLVHMCNCDMTFYNVNFSKF